MRTKIRSKPINFVRLPNNQIKSIKKHTVRLKTLNTNQRSRLFYTDHLVWNPISKMILKIWKQY